MQMAEKYALSSLEERLEPLLEGGEYDRVWEFRVGIDPAFWIVMGSELLLLVRPENPDAGDRFAGLIDVLSGEGITDADSALSFAVSMFQDQLQVDVSPLQCSKCFRYRPAANAACTEC